MRRRDTNRHGTKLSNSKLGKRRAFGGWRVKDVKAGRKGRNQG